jgi:hypothetical protein
MIFITNLSWLNGTASWIKDLYTLEVNNLVEKLKNEKMEKILCFFRNSNFTIEEYYDFFEKACEVDPNNISYMIPIFRGAEYDITISNTGETEFFLRYAKIQDYKESCPNQVVHIVVPNEKYKNELEKYVNNLTITKKMIKLHPDVCWKALYIKRFQNVELVREMKPYKIHLPHLNDIVNSNINKEVYYIITKIYNFENKKLGKCNDVCFYFANKN